MSTALFLKNQALLKAGISQTIADENENTQEAYTAGQFFDPVRREVLRAFPWGFATKYADSAANRSDGAMVLFAGTADAPVVPGRWTYAYKYPTDCLLA